ncbi:MAG: alcohol dehydrogenase catalytic domain-containing protein [Alphaproteobacteria bacterium]|nr:alcohol dehydrogenase catalytic domain-containing protein [Alphaproteobacteria bacterium]
MKALVYQGVENLQFHTDYATPSASDDDVLVRVHYCGICGSDMHAYLGHDARRPAPLILGHEVAGIVEGGVDDGKRVTVNPLVSCGECFYCKKDEQNLCENRAIISMPPSEGGFGEGGFADYITIPARNLVEVPDNVPLDKASLCEPLACGFHAVKKAKHITDINNALVLGGGAIGMGASLALLAHQVTNVTLFEPNPLRFDFISKNCGADMTILSNINEALQYDAVIDAVGFEQSRQTASKMVRAGGVIAHIGLGSATGGLDIRRITLQEITFIGTYTYNVQDFQETAEAIFSGKLGALDWHSVIPLAEGAEAFDAIKTGKVANPKVILQP